MNPIRWPNFSRFPNGRFINIIPTYRTVAVYRWLLDETQALPKLFKIPKWAFYLYRSYFKKAAHGHGIGRHSKEEVMGIMENDLQALSDFLGIIELLNIC